MRLKYTWIPFVLSLMVLIPMRFLQFAAQIAGVESFLISRDFVYVLLGLVAVFVLVIISMSLLSKNVPENIKIRKNIVSAVFATISGLLMVYSGGVALPVAFSGALEGSEPIKIAVLGLLTLLAGVVFLLVAACYYSGRNFFEIMPVVTIIPAIWAGARLVYIYIDHTSSASTVEGTFDVLVFVFLVLFLLEHARMFSNVHEKNVIKRLFAFGLPAISMALFYYLPVLYFSLQNAENLNLNLVARYLVYISLALYILSVLVDISLALRKISVFQQECLENGCAGEEAPECSAVDADADIDVEEKSNPSR